jgi:ATP-dependent helicase Lhr and Lhr-like helicase
LPRPAGQNPATTQALSFDDAVLIALQGWMQHLGPTTASEIGELLGLPASEIEKALLRMEASGTILRGKFRPADSRPAASASHEPETEWCERRLLARIHRLTVATLRKQIAPVTASQFMNWLLRWQHVAPGTQVRGEHGTLEVIRQLQGFEIPASAWERFVLARRISDYDPAHLDQLCLTGAVGWGRLSPHPATLEATGNERGESAAGDSDASRAHCILCARRCRLDASSSSRCGRFFDFILEPGGAGGAQTFEAARRAVFPDMVRATGRLKAEIETGLWELVAAGLVTADGFENLRALVTPKSASGSGLGKARRPRHAPGRWSLLHTEGADRDRSVESCCWMLLRRYGVVFRDLLVRETNLPRWRELQIGYRRLEDRGEVRGGRFVDGFLGEQFALPVAVESLRAYRKLPQSTQGERVVIAAADPLNLVGIIVPGERIPAISGRSVTFRDGMWDAEDALLASGY